MNVTELFRRLSYGELSNLALGNEGSGEIAEDNRAKLTNYVNQALLRLHTRFMLREDDLALRCYDYITKYRLNSDYAESNTARPEGCVPYIEDGQKPFKNDLIKVLGVRKFDACDNLPLNDVNHSQSVFTPQPDVLQVPFPWEFEVLAVTYQANHPLIDYGDMDARIDIPLVLEGALSSYVAYQVYCHMNGQENAGKAREYLNTHEMICQNVIEQDLLSLSVSSTNRKFHERGFV